MSALLSARLVRPSYSTAMVERPRLYARLEGWRSRRAVVIHAPAGYGKSSLIARWLDVAGLAGQAAWITLDEEAADPARFVADVAAALETLRPGVQALVQPILADPRGDPARALSRLLDGLADHTPVAGKDDHLLLVLDDLHRIQSPAVDALLLAMLERGPPTLHLVLLARRRTGPSLARLHAYEKLIFLTADDLRFTEAEVAAYLRARGFTTSTAAEVAVLTERSEGWVAGLQLAALAQRRPGDVGELAASLAGQQEWVGEFLASEVLDRQPPAIQRFLLQTAILDEFNAALCAAVTGDDQAHALLAAVARADLFLIRLDYAGGWHRYHHLFQELLCHRLAEQCAPEKVAALHRAAGRWLADAGRIQAAVRHFLAAGDDDAAADAVEAQVQAVLMQEPYRVKSLFALLPAAIAQRRPRLMLDRTFVAAASGDLDYVAFVERTQRALDQQAAAPELAARYGGELLILRSGAMFLQVQPEEAKQCLAAAAPLAALLPDHILGVGAFVRMHLAHQAGDHAAATRHADDALVAFGRAGFALGTVAVQREIARWTMRRGDSRAAAVRFHAIFEGWRRDQLYLSRDIIMSLVVAAENSYLQDAIEQALTYQRTALHLAEQLQDDTNMFLAERLGVLYAATLHPDSAPPPPLHLAGVTLTESTRDTLLIAETRWLVLTGSHADAWSFIHEAGLHFTHSTDDLQRDVLLPYLRAYIARGKALEEIDLFLDTAIDHYAALGNEFARLHLLALKAWQQARLHGATAAAPALAQARALARKTGFRRVLLDLPALAQIEAEIAAAPAGGGPVAVGATVDLLEKEQQVLDLLAGDQTYQEIARSLNISINTVRYYVRNVYSKLDVHRRGAAIARARALGLLPAVAHHSD